MSSPAWPSQQLKNLEQIGSLVREPTSRVEIQRLLDLAQASLSGAKTKSLAVEPRFQLAYSAAHHLALAALRANDYRTAAREGTASWVQTISAMTGYGGGPLRWTAPCHLAQRRCP